MQPIHRDELERWIEDGRDFALIEVLPPERFDEFHLPGAINVPVGQQDFGAAIERAVPDKAKPVVVYCQNLECTASPKAAERMDRIGYRQVHDYEAGKVDWKEAGLPIEGTPS